MTRGEIWKDFFKRTVLPAVIALFLFFMFKNVFTEDGQTNYFYVWLCCGIPFGIRRMFVWLVPHGYDIAGTVVTSANDAKTVNDAVRLGAVDYLVKPFAYERFRQALDVFCRRRESVQRDSFSQDVLDHTLFQAAAPTPPVTPPKGLQSQTLSRLEAYLRAAPETRHTSDEIASHVGLSVVTVRRYMNYLAEQQVIGSEMDYRTGGRPCLVYFLRN